MNKVKIFFLLVFCYLFIGLTITNFSFADSKKNEELKEYYEEQMKRPDYVTVKAKVIDIPFDDTMVDKPDVPLISDIRYQHLKVKILTGKHKGEIYTVRNTIEMISPYKLIIEKNNSILLNLTEDDQGKVVNLRVYERSRENNLYFIIGLFIFLLILIGGLKGLKSALTLIFTASMIIFVLLPLILKGLNPIIISVLVCIITVAVTLVVISGRNKKTLTAFLGTMGGVLIAGLLALAVGSASNLTGLGNEDAQLLAYIPQNSQIDFRGLLFAGIIIGALGAVMDVTMSVASAMREIEDVHPKIETKDLIRSGMNIGKDIMGSMSNTLILAYAGGSIHLMLLFMAFNMAPLEIINLDLIASEIVRAMAGSIGLICAIPLTAFIGATIGREY
ncbi:YibE/F family protein [Wukongibacter sp. M2B1]|uniref:YibE/F family protein n=1 Tax=Wukongibacter sp. M2B1 TaxID=3088895 RepID=UPI003D7B26DA